MRRVAISMLIVLVLAVVVLGLGDSLGLWLVSGQIAILLAIPISLALFTFIWHEQLKAGKRDDGGDK